MSELNISDHTVLRAHEGSVELIHADPNYPVSVIELSKQEAIKVVHGLTDHFKLSLEALQQSQWVSVEDKPVPEIHGTYLCKVNYYGNVYYEVFQSKSEWQTMYAKYIFEYSASALPPIEEQG